MPSLKPLNEKCYRVKEPWAINNWYGFIVTQNQSDPSEKHGLAQTLTFKSTHIKTYPPMSPEGLLDIEVPPGQTDVILVKRLDASATFAMTQTADIYKAKN